MLMSKGMRRCQLYRLFYAKPNWEHSETIFPTKSLSPYFVLLSLLRYLSSYSTNFYLTEALQLIWRVRIRIHA